ncbi:hypothetical protein EKO23_22445 [Nocardioides guangzhouensis]|uniref:Uncharacterized protein n=1 Tax=Nocardioides guangzhouensis TaxID=2497878 RepID=A0A4Q4Z3B2_9ACTN|nr:hypothetical protein [Nocardioides guangzhouensis]RYP82123.1 hypothetical protein EKO23_22445 [Nocardioides guangzhouensis]
MSISHILQSGLAEARSSGAKQVELQHLPDGGADELAKETLEFLRGRPGRPSAVSGWTAVSASNTGVMAWWADESGLTTEAQQRRLRTLRRQVYDLLDERGLIIKPASPSAAVDVSPAPVAAAETAPAEPAAEAAPAEAVAEEPARAEAVAEEPARAEAVAEEPAPAPAEAVAEEPAPEGPTAAVAPKAKVAKAKAAKAAKPKAAKADKPAKKAKAAKAAKPAKKAKATAVAGAAPAEPTATDTSTAQVVAAPDDVGAWVLRLDPTVWNLARFIADGHREVRAWAVEDVERSAAMTRGQRVFLWAGGDGTLVMAGVWGVGWVVGPCQSGSVADGYWTDPAGNSRHRLFADVSIQFLAHPVGRQQVVDDSRLANIEVLRDPFGDNPSRLTPDEAAAMLALVGWDPAPPA